MIFLFFFFFVHRLSTPVGTPSLSIQVKIQPTYLTLGVGFCVYGPFLSHYKSSHSPTSGSSCDLIPSLLHSFLSYYLIVMHLFCCCLKAIVQWEIIKCTVPGRQVNQYFHLTDIRGQNVTRIRDLTILSFKTKKIA